MRTPSAVGGWQPVLAAAALSLLALGPALGRGIVLSYDLVWSPDPRLTPFAMGEGTPAPRAVPSDAAAVLLGRLLTAPIAEKAVLLAILTLAGLGAAALLRLLRPAAGSAACAAAVALGIWNPFVAERLVIGQWTVLLGYAVLPWAARAALRVRLGTGSALSCCLWLVVAGVGGANTAIVVVVTVLVVLAYPAPLWRAMLAAIVTSAGVGAAWWLPALLNGVSSARESFAAFGARSDTPLGLVGSLLSGGGMWNQAAYPPERAKVVVALVALCISVSGIPAAARLRPARPLVVAAGLGLAVAALSGWNALEPAWSTLASVPGGGLLRDGQKLLAPWVVLSAVGFGVLVDALVRRGKGALAAASALCLLPVLSLPSLAWGVSGRLDAVTVPSDLRRGASVLSRLPDGDVAVLPWQQYRRYGWNNGHISLSLMPRMVDQRIMFDDSLPLSGVRVDGEDPSSAAVTRAIAGGADPYSAVARAGVRYVAIEHETGITEAPPPAGFGEIAFQSEHLTVIRLSAEAAPGTASHDGGLVTGWLLTLATAGLVGVIGATRHRAATRRAESLLRFRP